MTACSICAAIPAQAYGMQKHGREPEDEQRLIRFSPEEAQSYLDGAP